MRHLKDLRPAPETILAALARLVEASSTPPAWARRPPPGPLSFAYLATARGAACRAA